MLLVMTSKTFEIPQKIRSEQMEILDFQAA